MAIAYRIYSNRGNGGPVDFSAQVATTPGTTLSMGPLGASSDTTFVVRAYDAATGLEQAGAEASVRVVIGADGKDRGALPNAPHALALATASGGGARVSWAYAPAATSGAPTGFAVYLAEGSAPSYAAPAATVAYAPGRVGYSCTLPGPFAASVYTAAVRAFNAAGTEANALTAGAALGSPAPYAMDPVRVTVGALCG